MLCENCVKWKDRQFLCPMLNTIETEMLPVCKFCSSSIATFLTLRETEFDGITVSLDT